MSEHFDALQLHSNLICRLVPYIFRSNTKFFSDLSEKQSDHKSDHAIKKGLDISV
jgi:hypothetical protein